jgi:hypothetical protein
MKMLIILSSGCTIGLGGLSFILASAIPIFNYLLAFLGSICFAPLAIMLPGWLWLYDHGSWRTGGFAKSVSYWLHWAMIALGGFFCVVGTYANVQQIRAAYAAGLIGK